MIHEKSLIRPENLKTHDKLVLDGVDVSGHWSTFIEPRVVTDYNERLEEEIAALPGGENIHRCWQCGSCTNACTVNALNPDFNPRFWIYLIRMGMESELLRDKDIIWQCVSCHKCTHVCPRDVVPEGVMKATAHWLALKGHTPKSPSTLFDEEFSEQVLATGKIEEGRVIRNFFARNIRATRRPLLLFKHTLLPHLPWIYLPSGHQYQRRVRGPITGGRPRKERVMLRWLGRIRIGRQGTAAGRGGRQGRCRVVPAVCHPVAGKDQRGREDVEEPGQDARYGEFYVCTDNESLEIVGTNFQRGAQVSFSGTGVTVNSTVWDSSTSLSVHSDVSICDRYLFTTASQLTTTVSGMTVVCWMTFTRNRPSFVTAYCRAYSPASCWMICTRRIASAGDKAVGFLPLSRKTLSTSSAARDSAAARNGTAAASSTSDKLTHCSLPDSFGTTVRDWRCASVSYLFNRRASSITLAWNRSRLFSSTCSAAATSFMKFSRDLRSSFHE